MATTFLEPGGDADFLVGTTNGFWKSLEGTPAVATDFVHGTHVKSIKYRPTSTDVVHAPTGVLADAGSRINLWIYLVALPSSTSTLFTTLQSDNSTISITVRLTSAGIIQLWNSTTVQVGTNGPTLATGQWYRISLAYTITSTTVNRFELFVNGASAISATNITLTNISTSIFAVGNRSNNGTLDFRSSDHYIDNSSALTDPGNIWVTAKRPNANGTTNGFSTQIGSGGSGYGSGHSPQVNERPLNTANGWSMIGAGSAITEEYSIEGKATGDIDISLATIIDFLGWVSASALASETGQIIVAGANSNIALTSTITLFTKIAGSAVYPAGSTDIGIITSTTVTTVSLYEAGILVAFIPLTAPSVSDSITVSENFQPQIVSFINVNNSVTISENISLVFAVSINKSDSITVSESVTLFFPLLGINVFDSITVSEDIFEIEPLFAPVVSFQSRSAPYPVITSLMYVQSALGGNNLPVLGGEVSNILYFRIYNNYAAGKNIATMENVQLTVFDGVGAGSHSGVKSVSQQSWIRIYESGFGENSLPPGLYTQFLGQDTAIGKSALDIYVPEFGSDGSSVSRIRAGVDTNGVGFIEFATYVETPDQIGFYTYGFAVSILYDWFT